MNGGIPKYELDKLVGENHQGIILVVDDYKYEEVENLVKYNH